LSRIETTMTIGTSIVAALFSHMFCCGLLPMVLNASASAVMGSLTAQFGVAILTTLAIATGVTFYECHRHASHVHGIHCAGHHDHDHNGPFNTKVHFVRNLIIGSITFTFFAFLTHLPAVHNFLEQIFNI
jgi:hypothetical protein